MVRKIAYLVAAVSTLTILLGFTVRAQTLRVHVYRTTAKAVPTLTVVATRKTWFGKPIFSLTNTSDFTLRRMALKSWSNHLLPILFVGRNKPKQWPEDNTQLAAPPYRLAPQETLWFVGPNASSTNFNLYWTDGDKPVYEVVHAK